MKTIRKYQFIRIGFISLLLLAASHLLAGEYDVAGRVINTQKDPIKNAVVTLSDAKTNAPVATTLCDARGNFNFTNIPEGEYIISGKKGDICRSKIKKLTVYSDGTVVTEDLENPEKKLFATR
jgi:hypothetical protein